MTEDRLDRELDDILARLPVAQAPDGLAARILADAPKAKRPGLFSQIGGALFPGGQRWPAGAALASLFIGLTTGYAATAQEQVYTDEPDAVVSSAFGLDQERFVWETGDE